MSAVLLTRMRARIGGDLNQLIEYVVNNAAAWTFPEVADEKPEDRERALAGLGTSRRDARHRDPEPHRRERRP